MKPAKHISIVLTFLILFSNIGLALNVHYCHGRVSSVSVAYKTGHCSKKAEPRSCCAMAARADKKCCKSHLVKLHDKADHILVKSLGLDLGQFYAADAWKPTALFYTEVPVAVTQTPAFYCDSHAPPLFKLHCQFVFYA